MPEPGLGFPIDESPRGPRDMAGSVSEWLDAWLNEEAGYRRFASGSWADGGPENIFHIYGGNGLPPDRSTDMVGFRLALDIEPANASGER
jgi:formylglycine-generating enzyme required for sulfatase activity